MMQKLRFSIGGGLGQLVRDAFWFEQRFDRAKRMLECFEEIDGKYYLVEET